MSEEHEKKVLEELNIIRWTLLAVAAMIGLMLLIFGLAFMNS
jgi:hypothetical protein